jgi:hypothetical protein
VLNSFAILFVGTIDDMGEVKEFRLDFDDNYDLIGYGEYAMNYVGLHLRAANGLQGKLAFCCALMNVAVSTGQESSVPAPASAAPASGGKVQAKKLAKKPSHALGWGGTRSPASTVLEGASGKDGVVQVANEDASFL